MAGSSTGAGSVYFALRCINENGDKDKHYLSPFFNGDSLILLPKDYGFACRDRKSMNYISVKLYWLTYGLDLEMVKLSCIRLFCQRLCN